MRDALNSLTYMSIVGNVYKVPTLAGNIFRHPFYCQQRRNDSNPTGGVVYPPETPGLVDAVSPARPFLFTQSWLDYVDSLNKKDGISKRLLIIAIVVPIAFSVFLVALLLGVFFGFTRLYHLVFISKKRSQSAGGDWS